MLKLTAASNKGIMMAFCALIFFITTPNPREYAALDIVGRVLVTSQPTGNESYRCAKLVGSATYASAFK